MVIHRSHGTPFEVNGQKYVAFVIGDYAKAVMVALDDDFDLLHAVEVGALAYARDWTDAGKVGILTPWRDERGVSNRYARERERMVKSRARTDRGKARAIARAYIQRNPSAADDIYHASYYR